MSKKWTKSKGIQGGSIALITSLIISITPRVSNIINSYVHDVRTKDNIEEVAAIFIEIMSFIGMGGASYGIVGRIVAKGPLFEMGDSPSTDDINSDNVESEANSNRANRYSSNGGQSNQSATSETFIRQALEEDLSPDKSFGTMFGR